MNSNNKYKIRLYSRTTFVWKYILPLALPIGVSFELVENYINYGTIDLESAFIFTVISIILIFLYSKTQRVFLDDEFMYIDNYRKSVQIPITEVDEVTDYIFPVRFIVIKFKGQTKLGKHVIFIPYFLFLQLQMTHPVTIKLRNRIKSLTNR